MVNDNETQGQHYNFDTGDLLESSESWWKARGKTAAEAAYQLATLADQVNSLFSTNYWGDCVEGHTTHGLFRDVIDTWVTDLREQAASARNRSDACYSAARTISAANKESAGTITSI